MSINRSRFRPNGFGQASPPGIDQYMKFRKDIPDDLKPRYLRAGTMTVTGDGSIVGPGGGGVAVSPGGPVFASGALNQFEDDRQLYFKQMRDDLDVLVATNVIDRGLIGRVVTVTSTPILVAKAQALKGYLITNPSATSGLTATGTTLASANRAALASGNTQATPLGVANYDRLALWLSITGGTGGVVTVNALTQDPVSLNWATSQASVFSQSAVGTYYANIGNVGVDTAFAISWSVSAAGTSTFSVGYMLKDGLAGSSSGLSNTVYLGGSSGVSTVSGYSLLEGKEFRVYMRSQTELWAVSGVSGGIGLRVFELA